MAETFYRRETSPKEIEPTRPCTVIPEFVMDRYRVRILGRLHFLIFSRSERGVGWGVDLEQDEHGYAPGCACGEFHHRPRRYLCGHYKLAARIATRIQRWPREHG